MDAADDGVFCELAGRVFEESGQDYLHWRLDNMPDVTVFIASVDGVPAGFKAGYAATGSRYYSWLGGVDPAWRRLGVGAALMVAQHQWLMESRYDLVETHVDQENTAMIALNMAHGFEITGMFLKRGKPNYIMQRNVVR